MTEYSDACNGQKSPTDLFEPVPHPGYQTEAQANDPYNPELFPPDYSAGALAYSEWKKAQSNAGTPK